MTDLYQILKEALKCYKLEGLKLLDAGSGPWSASTLLAESPAYLTCVCAPQDTLKIRDTMNALGGERKGTEVVGADLSVQNVFPSESFDFILADYLISEIDIYAPKKHVDVLKALYQYLKRGGHIVIMDSEPDLQQTPEMLDLIYSDTITDKPLKLDDMEIDNITRYRYHLLVRNFLHNLSINKGMARFTKIPVIWIENWMAGIGFTKIHVERTSRIIKIDIDEAFEEKIRRLLELIPDAKLRKYLDALLDRSEGLLREVCPFDYEEKVYIIKAGKE